MVELPENRCSVRVQLSEDASTETLRQIHACANVADLPPDYRELFERIGVEQIRSVHRLAEHEIAEDKYGFAREFVLDAKPTQNPDQILKPLRMSHLIKDVKLVRLRPRFPER